ncbi:unnamed protein product [Durusdinium trenchii]|uniref:EF-hand domain-containing protein n=1 Tax=Durusdinium trenchii TaxID=1381693 RepID=A0ABP0HC88_9DINO
MAMEAASHTACRARRILVGAKSRQKESWDELFQAADKDRSRMLDLKELKIVIREKLHIPESALTDFEIQSIHGEIDLDQSGVIDWSEFLTFVARGPKRPEDEAKLFALRTKRVHRNLRMAFNKFQTDQAAVQKLFEKIDRGSDGKISIHELLSFVRSDLKLSKWDVFESEMKSFYRTMDTDGDGVVVEELLQFIHKTRSSFQKGKLDKFSFVEDPRPGNVRKQPTYRMQLLSERMPKARHRPSFRMSFRASTNLRSRVLECGRTSEPEDQLFAPAGLDPFLRESGPIQAAHRALSERGARWRTRVGGSAGPS